MVAVGRRRKGKIKDRVRSGEVRGSPEFFCFGFTHTVHGLK